MDKRKQSSISDTESSVSLERDVGQGLFDTLREARLSRQLTQQQLARRLGLRQRQISDLERAAMDPRLSTVHNVARALDLELMLIPRDLISAVEGLQRARSDSPKRPMYALDDHGESSPSDSAQAEVGGTDEPRGASARQRRSPEGQRR